MKKYILLLLLVTTIHANNSDITVLYNKAKESIVEYNGQSEKIEEAKLFLKKIGNINSDSKEFKIISGKLIFLKAYISNDDYRVEYLDLVKKLAQDVLDNYPNNIDALILFSSAYRNDGTKEGLKTSKEIINKAYNIDKNNIIVLLSLLNTYKKEKRNDEALQIGKSIIEKSTKFWQESAALSDLTTIYKRLKQYNKANEAYLRIINLEPDSPWALVNYASFLSKKHPYKDYDKAISYAKKSLEKSQFGMGYYVLSKAYYGKGYKMFWGDKGNLNKEGAGKWFKLGVEAYSSSYDNYYGIGSYYYYLGTKNKDVKLIEQSIKAFEKCVKLKPSYKLAQNRLRKTKELLKRLR